AQSGEQRAVTGQETLIQQADVELGILVVNLQAFGRSAHRLAHAQARIPKFLQKGRNGGLIRPRQLVGPAQQQQIDVRKGEELAPAVTARGEQRKTLGNGGKQQPVGGLHHHAVHPRGALRQRNQRIGGSAEGW